MGSVVHFEIHCADLDRAERFYTDVFGWQVFRWEGAPIDYRLITTGPDDQVGINGPLTQRRGEIDGEAVIAYVNTIEVDDLAETQRRIGDGGGQMVLEPAEIPNVGTVAYFKDIEGNIFGALQPA
jgi:predicted enzyme related to lactoylglutathione lyase